MNLTLPFPKPLPKNPGERLLLGQLTGASLSLAIYSAIQARHGLLVVITPDLQKLSQLERELHFFRGNDSWPILSFPDWETLPYDHFSPHADIISERLGTLYQLSIITKGILLVSANTLMQRLAPKSYLQANSLVVKKGQHLSIESFRQQLEKSGYRHVSQVIEHGEYAIRGALLDIYPMGSQTPYRLDLFDEEVDSVRTFDPDTQRTVAIIPEVRYYPLMNSPLLWQPLRIFVRVGANIFKGIQWNAHCMKVSAKVKAPQVLSIIYLYFLRKLRLYWIICLHKVYW